jgi:hypothetical protein
MMEAFPSAFGQPSPAAPQVADALVLFGATGDLSKKKLLPAL